MKPPPFDYYAPTTVDKAVELLDHNGDGAKVLAGGQSLVSMLNLRLARIDRLVDLNRIEGLDYIRVESGSVAIGAATTQQAVERSPEIAAALPVLPAALSHVGHFQIRNRGTVAGSICHADPAAELPAVWLALGGEVTARSTAGARKIRCGDFFSSYFTTTLEPNEIVTEVSFNTPKNGTGWSFSEVARRHGDFAMVGVVTLLSVTRKAIDDARVVVFGAGPTPIRVTGAEQVLVGTGPTGVDDHLLDQVAAEVGAAVRPGDDVHGSADYRRHVAGVLARRGVVQSIERAGSKANV